VTIFSGNRALLEAFRRGDRAALTEVYHRYVNDLAALVRCGFVANATGGRVRGVRELDHQRDLIQEAFLRAFSANARRAYDGVSPFRPYILRIAKNLMIDEARKAGQIVDSGADELACDGVDVEIPSPEDDLEWHRLREATRAYCATLSEKLQQFVRLRFEEERSQRDTAEALQVTRRKVRSWEREVREGLRRCLKGMTDACNQRGKARP
jgi:RNA polymerase sigma factor (sigma-70 family)